MDRPNIHVFTTRKSEAQAVVRSTLEIARRPDVRVIIIVDWRDGSVECAHSRPAAAHSVCAHVLDPLSGAI